MCRTQGRPPVQSASGLILPLAFGHGIVRGQMFDVDVVVRKGLAIAVLLLVGAGTYTVLVSVANAMAGGNAPRTRSRSWRR